MNKFFLFFFLALISISVLAENNGKSFDVLLSKLNSADQLYADFSQKTVAENGTELQSFTGVMFFERPGKFFWQANEPNPQLLVSNGKTIWHYDEDLEQVIVQSFAKQKNEAPLLLILESSDVLKDNFSLDNVIETPAKTIFELKAKSNQAGLIFVLLQFSDSRLTHIAFVDQLDQRTDIVLVHKGDSAVMPKTFEFVIPDGVDVLYE